MPTFANLEIVKLTKKDNKAASSKKAAVVRKVYLVVDVSGSMWGKTGSVEGSVQRMIGALEARGCRVTVINYDSNGSMKIQYNDVPARDITSLDFQPRGLTCPSQALHWVTPHLESGVAVILHSDGWFNDPSAMSERNAAFAFADAVKSAGAVLVTVAHGEGADGATLLEMASRAGGMFVADSGKSVFSTLETAVTVVESKGTSDKMDAPDGWLLLNEDNELSESVRRTPNMWKVRACVAGDAGKWSKTLTAPLTHIIKSYAAAMNGAALVPILNAGFWDITGGTKMLTKNVMYRLNQEPFTLTRYTGKPLPDIMVLLNELKGKTVRFVGAELKRRSLFEAEEPLPYMPGNSDEWLVKGYKVASASVTLEMTQTVPLVDRKTMKQITIMGVKPQVTQHRSLQVISGGEIQPLPLYVKSAGSPFGEMKVNTSLYSFGSDRQPDAPTRNEVVALYQEKFYNSAKDLFDGNNEPPVVTKDLEGLKAKEVDGVWTAEWRGGKRKNPFAERKEQAITNGWIDTYNRSTVSFAVNGWTSLENQSSAAKFLSEWYGVESEDFKAGFKLPERKVRPRATWSEQQDMMLGCINDVMLSKVGQTVGPQYAARIVSQKMNLLALELSAIGTIPWGVVEEGKKDSLIYKLENGVTITLVEKEIPYTTTLGMAQYNSEKNQVTA